MDVDLPMMDEGNNGKDDIPKTQDDCLSAFNKDAIGTKEEELEQPLSPSANKV